LFYSYFPPFITSVCCPIGSSTWSITAYPSHNVHFRKPLSPSKYKTDHLLDAGGICQ
jgi:hypothetical protein